MKSRRIVALSITAALVVAVLSSGALSGASAATKKPAVQRVSVTAKEYKFTLSKKKVNTGTVIFTVTNKGKIGHDFSIGGKKTPIISPGKSATLKVTFKKKGQFKYTCTVPGHARLGMKGTLAVGTAPKPTTTTPTTPTTAPAPAVGTVASTIDVSMTEYSFTLTENGAPVTSVPSGPVTFVITNNGSITHNFDLMNVPGVSAQQSDGMLLGAAGTQTLGPLNLPPGNFTYQCDVPEHAGYGMIGTLAVTPDP